jgi:hypothetical protein
LLAQTGGWLLKFQEGFILNHNEQSRNISEAAPKFDESFLT